MNSPNTLRHEHVGNLEHEIMRGVSPDVLEELGHRLDLEEATPHVPDAAVRAADDPSATVIELPRDGAGANSSVAAYQQRRR